MEADFRAVARSDPGTQQDHPRHQSQDWQCSLEVGADCFRQVVVLKDYAAHSYTIDEIPLEPVIALDTKEYRPAGLPLARVLAKLKVVKPMFLS